MLLTPPHTLPKDGKGVGMLVSARLAPVQDVLHLASRCIHRLLLDSVTLQRDLGIICGKKGGRNAAPHCKTLPELLRELKRTPKSSKTITHLAMQMVLEVLWFDIFIVWQGGSRC